MSIYISLNHSHSHLELAREGEASKLMIEVHLA